MSDGSAKPESGTWSGQLLSWYDANRRPLPWRESTDAYRVWVSEVMLQQTRVETVIPYFQRWLQRFPTLDALANADLDAVLLHWQGLGYYSRARNFHHAARIVRDRHDSRVPDNTQALRKLPGVGEYTAGAVASIAYQQVTPAVDGNVKRVFARVLDTDDALRIRDAAHALVDAARPGDYNQALMELGATVCTPRAPACANCPVATHCLALARGTVPLRPARKQRAPLPHEYVTTLAWISNGRILLTRREPNGLLGGLWAFPAVPKPPALASSVGEVTHKFTHKLVTFQVFWKEAYRKAAPHERWVDIDAVAGIPMSTAHRKIGSLLAKHGIVPSNVVA